ncbi:hypothetical protein V1282_007024 [Nitrobacteraceae bacterium AZCC 2146]
MLRQQLSLKSESAVGTSVPFFSDDECVQKLAMLMEHRDSKSLGEIAALISRLAVPIE